MPYLIGVDIGSTSLKAAVYDYDGRLVSLGTCPNEAVNLDADHPHWVFWDPGKIWSGVSCAIKKAIAGTAGPQSITGVAVTGMGMDGLPVDKNGCWLYPFISWQCRRTQEQYSRWIGNYGSGMTFCRTGKQLLAFDTLFRITWMRENYPDILARADKWLLIEDYVNFMLCSSRATDYSMASSTSMLDLEKREWSDEILDVAGIDKGLLPEILPSGSIIGAIGKSAAAMTGIAEGTPVIMGGHDYHCAALAAGAFMPGTVMDITGTWEMVLAATDRLCIPEELLKSGLSAECHVVKDVYGIMGSNVSGGMLEWFRSCYGYEEKLLSEKEGTDAWKLLMSKAEAAPCGSGGVFFLPHFLGSSCPQTDPYSLGAFVGMDMSTGKDDMLRALIEGLDYQLRDMLESMEQTMPLKAEKLTVVGGAAANPFWMQNKADVTGLAVEVPGNEEATCLGAAMLAGIGTGIYKDEKEAFLRVFRSGCRYEPDPDTNRKYNDYYSIYKCLYPSLGEISNVITRKFKM